MTFPRTTWHTARVRHTCETCLRKIRVGERYLYEVGTWEGAFYSQCICLFCNRAWVYIWHLEGHLDPEDIGDLPEALTETHTGCGYLYALGIGTGWEYCRPAPALTAVPA